MREDSADTFASESMVDYGPLALPDDLFWFDCALDFSIKGDLAMRASHRSQRRISWGKANEMDFMENGVINAAWLAFEQLAAKAWRKYCARGASHV